MDNFEIIESVSVYFFEDLTRYSTNNHNLVDPVNLTNSVSTIIENNINKDPNSRERLLNRTKESKRARIECSLGPDFITYLVEGVRNEVTHITKFVLKFDNDLISFSKDMNSRDSSFWKEAIK